jgi:hypothetical protein
MCVVATFLSLIINLLTGTHKLANNKKREIRKQKTIRRKMSRMFIGKGKTNVQDKKRKMYHHAKKRKKYR